ncbi:unnamed protein product [Absidia cylindrospora]
MQTLSKPFKNSKLIHCLHILSSIYSTPPELSPFLPPLPSPNQRHLPTLTTMGLPMSPSSPYSRHTWTNGTRHARNMSNSSTGKKDNVMDPFNYTTAPTTTTPTATFPATTTSSAASGKQGPLSCWYERLGSVRALLVDDNPVNQKVLSRMLDRLGLTCDIAQNGRQALEKWIESEQQGTPLELIFMDVFMPEMNGLEATTKIRMETTSTPTYPYIIAMTACVMAGDKEKCIDAGMNGYVSKPVRKEELEAAIHTFTQVATISMKSEDDALATDNGDLHEST